MFQQIRLRSAGVLMCVSLLLAACAGTPKPAPRVEPAPVAAPVCPPAPQPAPQSCPACPACAACPVCPPPPAPEAKPLPPKLVAAEWAALEGWSDDDLRESLPALRASCSAVANKPGWAEPCAALVMLDATDRAAVRAFYESFFRPWQLLNGDGSDQGLVTGYYEPLLKASRTRGGAYKYAIHAVPDDLLVIDLASVHPDLKNMRLRGRLDGRKVVPYWTRAELDARAAELDRKALFWAADAIDVFFLQVQGSGRLRAPDGSVVRIGYAGQNGQPYTGIGGLMRERGLIGSGPGQYPGSMQGIIRYIRDYPAEGAALMRENRSWVFFRELKGEGPLGALNVPVRPLSSLAADPRFVPLGAPVWLDLDRREAGGLWIAQDTGGAIKGANRFDTFWGAGEQARLTAGGMSSRGSALIFLPKGTLKRIGAQ